MFRGGIPQIWEAMRQRIARGFKIPGQLAAPAAWHRRHRMLNHVTFHVVAENHPDVLARIVMLLHRLNLNIQGIAMQRPKQRRRMTLTLDIELLSGEADRVTSNLLKVVRVKSVSSRNQTEKPFQPLYDIRAKR